MIKISRTLISSLSAAFGMLNGVFVLLHLHHFKDSVLVTVTVLGYFAVLLTALIANRGLRLSSPIAFISLTVTVIIPAVMQLQHNALHPADYETWYVTGNAILLGVIAVRGYQLLAALGVAIQFAEVIYFGGINFIPRSGIIGAILLVAACTAISVGLQRASHDIEKIQAETIEVETASKLAEVSRQEHASRVQRLINQVMPTLRLIEAGKKLGKQDRIQVAALDIQLRDELAGGNLVTPSILKAAADARARGAEVTIVDQGGSIRISNDELKELLDTAELAISSANEGDRIRLTAPAAEHYVLRLTKTRSGVVTPDLDLKLGEGLV